MSDILDMFNKTEKEVKDNPAIKEESSKKFGFIKKPKPGAEHKEKKEEKPEEKSFYLNNEEQNVITQTNTVIETVVAPEKKKGFDFAKKKVEKAEKEEKVEMEIRAEKIEKDEKLEKFDIPSVTIPVSTNIDKAKLDMDNFLEGLSSNNNDYLTKNQDLNSVFKESFINSNIESEKISQEKEKPKNSFIKKFKQKETSTTSAEKTLNRDDDVKSITSKTYSQLSTDLKPSEIKYSHYNTQNNHQSSFSYQNNIPSYASYSDRKSSEAIRQDNVKEISTSKIHLKEVYIAMYSLKKEINKHNSSFNQHLKVIEELQKLSDDAIATEDYDKAAEIEVEIAKMKADEKFADNLKRTQRELTQLREREMICFNRKLKSFTEVKDNFGKLKQQSLIELEDFKNKDMSKHKKMNLRLKR